MGIPFEIFFLEKMGIFNLQSADRILMKFYIKKDIVSQSSYFKS